MRDVFDTDTRVVGRVIVGAIPEAAVPTVMVSSTAWSAPLPKGPVGAAEAVAPGVAVVVAVGVLVPVDELHAVRATRAVTARPTTLRRARDRGVRAVSYTHLTLPTKRIV